MCHQKLLHQEVFSEAMCWANTGCRKQCLCDVQSPVVIVRFIALLILLRGSVQKVTDNAILCLTTLQILHDSDWTQNMPCEVMWAVRCRRSYWCYFPLFSLFLVVSQLLWLSEWKGKTRTICDAAGGNSHMRFWLFQYFCFFALYLEPNFQYVRFATCQRFLLFPGLHFIGCCFSN